MRIIPLMACGLVLATGAFAQDQPPGVYTPPTLPPLPALPLERSSVGEGGLITLAPDRQLTVTLDPAHAPTFEAEWADTIAGLPVAEAPRTVDDDLDNFNAPFFPAIKPGKLVLTLWYNEKKGSILFTQNGTGEALVYTAAILAKRPNGAVARALTTICAVPGNAYAGQVWEDKLDAIEILKIAPAPGRGCLNGRTGVFALNVAPAATAPAATSPPKK